MAKLNNIKIYKGEAIAATFTIAPVADITAWTILFTLKRNQTDPVPLLSKACSVVSGPLGTFSLALTKAETTQDAAAYAYDIQRTDVGSEAVLSIGSFTIQQEVLVA